MSTMRMAAIAASKFLPLAQAGARRVMQSAGEGHRGRRGYQPAGAAAVTSGGAIRVKTAMSILSLVGMFAISTSALAQDESTETTTTTTVVLPPAAVQIVNGGKLTGATGVIVNGTSYNVAFLDGTCASVFGACEPSNFAFTTSSTALGAAQALLDQVFLDNNQGLFDTNPALALGCSAKTCNVLIPYSAGNSILEASLAYNDPGQYDYAGDSGPMISSSDSGTSSSYTFAKFTLAAASPSATGAVPEPASWAMMIGGFGMIGAALRHRTRTSISFV